ncbi:ABC transporter permease subunit [Glutamicibacter protophormiae]|uniref:ABC transporter permease subunit n=1 Tax=Glutamicibacter protophormiae TaxID=37930 RepID=UPI003A8CDBD8
MSLAKSSVTAQTERRRWPLLKHLPILAVIAVLACFFLWPLVQVLYRSLSGGGAIDYLHPSITFAHYASLFTDPAIGLVLKNTIVISVLSALVSLLVGFPLAYLMSRVSARTAMVIYSLILLPLGVNILVRLFGVLQLFAPNGPVNWTLAQWGLSKVNLLYTTGMVVFGMVIYLLPILVLVLYSGMVAVEPSLITAAKAAGASGTQAFMRVFLPLVRSSTIGGTLLIFVLALGFFVTPDVLGTPSNMMISVYISGQVQNYQWGESSAAGMVLLVVALAFAMIAIKLSGLASLASYGGGGKGVGRREPLRLSVSSVILWGVCVVAITSLLAPLVLVVVASVDPHLYPTWPPSSFSLTWYVDAFTDPRWSTAAFTSLRVAVYAMILATLMGFFGARALLATRSKVLGGTLVGVFYAPLIVPSILLAIGTLDTQRVMGLFGTDLGLAAAQACLSVPFTVTIFLASLRAIDHRLEEAAWTLGASKRHATLRVVVPLILASAIGAALISFLNSWDEVVIAVFQTTGDSATLPVLFYSYVKEGFRPTINAVGTLLILLAAAIITFSSMRNKRPRTKKTKAFDVESSGPTLGAIEEKAVRV